MEIYDLTFEISNHSITYPGDPAFKSSKIMDIEKGDSYTLCNFSFGNHTGTHIDFPSHIIPGGKSSSHYPLSYLMGNGKVIEVLDDGHVSAEHLQNKGIQKGDIIFFKTMNSRNKLQEQKEPTTSCSAISPEAANLLIKHEVKIVGIDYLSVDMVNNESLPIHNALLSHGILIVENINLQNIEAGSYYFNISPLKIDNVDGLPVRISATKNSTTPIKEKNENKNV